MNSHPSIPVIAFSAWSGTGKTTLIEKLIPALKAQGLRVAVIKHDAHDFEIDKEGKDSWRFAHAGADLTILSSKTKTALFEQRSLTFSDLLNRTPDADIILAEGYNDLSFADSEKTSSEESPSYIFRRIGISRKATNKGFRLPLSSYDAIVTDDPDVLTASDGLPCFSFDDIQGLAEYIIRLIP